MSNGTVILHIAGLGTPADSELAGLRPTLRHLAALFGAELRVWTWDQLGLNEEMRALDGKRIYASGHSFGGGRLCALLNEIWCPQVAAVALLDVCTPGAIPMGPWPRPRAAESGLAFWQRNDVPLCGRKFTADVSFDVYDVTSWGLHHAGPGGMCADRRVQDLIWDLYLYQHLVYLRELQVAGRLGEKRETDDSAGTVWDGGAGGRDAAGSVPGPAITQMTQILSTSDCGDGSAGAAQDAAPATGAASPEFFSCCGVRGRAPQSGGDSEVRMTRDK